MAKLCTLKRKTTYFQLELIPLKGLLINYDLAYFPHITSKLRSVEVFLLVILMIYLGDMMEIKGILIASLITVVVQTIVRLYIAYRFILSGVRVSHFLRFSAILSFSTTFVLIAASLNDGSVVNPPGIDEVAVFVFGWICLALYLFFIRKTFKGSCEVKK